LRYEYANHANNTNKLGFVSLLLTTYYLLFTFSMTPPRSPRSDRRHGSRRPIHNIRVHGAPEQADPRSHLARKGDRGKTHGRPYIPSQHNASPSTDTFGAVSSDVVRVIPLGGVEEVGKNMTVVECGNTIVIIDMGFQFTDEETPGVDYIVPDTTYLETRKHKIKGVFITHGHLDHIGGIPYMIEKLGYPAIYTRRLTSMMIKKRQDEYPHLAPLRLEVVEKDGRVRLSEQVAIRFFNVTHTIPDSMGIVVETPQGNIVFTGDFKIDHNDGVPTEQEEKTFDAIGTGNNLLLLADSTNVERPGFSFSERSVHENIEGIIKEMKGRLIIGTFASLLERIIFIINTAERLGKKISIEGRSMKTNIEIAKELGLLKVKKETFISSDELDTHPPSKIIVLATGAQGDEFAALMRIGNKQHKKIRLNKTDTVILSSSIIPGNERSVQKLKDNLARQGATILHYRVLDVHSSGHAYAEESKWIMRKIKPRFFIPIHGYHQFLRVHASLAKEVGIQEENIIVPDNGMIIEFYDGGKKYRIVKGLAGIGVIMVDALGTGDIKEVVVRDRQLLATDGIFVIISTVDVATGKMRKSPDIISRGFIYLKESQDLLRHVRIMTKKSIEEGASAMHPINFDYIKNTLRERVAKFLLQKTGKRPIVLPVILEI